MIAHVLAFLCLGIITLQAQYYAKGQFPAGTFVDESSVVALIGRQVPANTYLVGRFVYLLKTGDQFIFSNGRLDLDGFVAGDDILVVEFHENVPPNLKIGSVMIATKEDPLTLVSVERSEKNKQIVLIAAESWSTP
jgi:hypothetical protein